MKQILFNGKLNYDTAPKFLPEADYVGAKNIIFQTSKDGNRGLMRLYPGFSNEGQIEGTVLGAFEDRAKRRVFVFTDDNKIYKYQEGVITLIFDWEGLNLSGYITGIGVIGDYLYWTDNINQPRYINTNENYVDIIEDDITLIRPAPLFPLDVNVTDGYGYSFSFLSGNAYQFSYRYLYEDNQVSVIAPWTRNFYIDDSVEVISVSKNASEEIPKRVRRIEYLVRRQDWDFWQIFASSTPENFDTVFYTGDQLGRAISSIDATKLFDSVPLMSKALEVARDRVFLANNTEGYDSSEILSLTATTGSDEIPEPNMVSVWRVIREESFSEGESVTLIETVTYWLRPDDGTRMYFLANGPIDTYFNGMWVDQETPLPQYTGDETDLDIPVDEFTNIWELTFSNVQGINDFDISNSEQVSPAHLVLLTFGELESLGERKFKNRSQYRIGIAFYDRYLRSGGVYTNENCIVSITDDFRSGNITTISWSLLQSDSPNIPIWADSYQIVRTDNISRVSFLQGRTSDILYVYRESEVDKYSREFIPDAEFIEIDISGSFKDGFRYNFTDGDLMEIETPSGVFTTSIIGSLGSKIRIPAVSRADFTTIADPFPIRYFFEIFRRRSTSETTVYYEVSEVFPVLGKRTLDRSFSAISGFLRGDVTVVEANTFDYDNSRTPVAGDITGELIAFPVPITIEAENPANDSLIGWVKDIGRPTIELEIGQVVKENAIRFSNKFIQGTRVNGTSSFNSTDEEIIGIENGQINKLQLASKQQREGTVMLAICEIECLSVYLGETQIIDNEGNQVVGSTQRVIGTVNVLGGANGTIHPESVVFHQGRVWWWDFYNKRVLRYDSNGIRNISELGAKSYFYPKDGLPVTGYDPFHNLFFIGFKNETEVISFDENENHWRSQYEFVPDYCSKVDDFLISFKTGSVYRSNDVTRGVFFDEQTVGRYEFYIQYPSPQLLNVISLYLSKNMFSWEGGKQVLSPNIIVEAENDDGQYTSLVQNDFDVMESVVYAHFLRDLNSGGFLTGSEMRSDLFKITLIMNGEIGIETIIINGVKSSGHL